MDGGNRSTLAALISPTPLERFFSEFWPERVFHSHGPLSRLPAVFSTNELSNFSALAAGFRDWMGFGNGSRSARMMSVQGMNPAHLYELGLTVHLPDITSSVPEVVPFLRALEKDLRIEEGSARFTVWASPQGDGVPDHFDGEDVFSIQLAGTKCFEVAPMTDYACPFGVQFGPTGPPFDEMYPQLKNGFPMPANVKYEAIDMRPGSVLFLPRGTWHRTHAGADSFAISIGIRPPTVLESFLEQLRYVLLQDPEWRRPLYGVRGDPLERQRALERAGKVLKKAPRLVEALSVDHLAPLTEAEKLQNVTRETGFQRDFGTQMEISRSGAGEIMIQVKCWNRDEGEKTTLQMKATAEYGPVFEWLSNSKAAFSAGELAECFPDVSFGQHQKLLAALTRGKFLRLLWFPRVPREDLLEQSQGR